MNCAPSGRLPSVASASTKKRTGANPVLNFAFTYDTVARRRRKSGLRGFALGVQLVHQPRLRDEEQRREKEAEERVQPNKRDVEAAKAKADPQGAQRTMRFQASAPEKVIRTPEV